MPGSHCRVSRVNGVSVPGSHCRRIINQWFLLMVKSKLRSIIMVNTKPSKSESHAEDAFAFTIAWACWRQGQHEAAQIDRNRNGQRPTSMTRANGGTVVMPVVGKPPQDSRGSSAWVQQRKSSASGRRGLSANRKVETHAHLAQQVPHGTPSGVCFCES